MNNCDSKTLMHYGVLGMHWGVRRYQPYPDGYKGEGKFKGIISRFAKRRQKKLENDSLVKKLRSKSLLSINVEKLPPSIKKVIAESSGTDVSKITRIPGGGAGKIARSNMHQFTNTMHRNNMTTHHVISTHSYHM